MGSGLHRHTENNTYAPTRSAKHIVTPKGIVRRVSTAVLLDQTVRWDGIGAKARRSLVPPSAELLKGVHDIVAGITGFTEQRGDQITIETLPFENTLQAEPPQAPSPPAKPLPVGLMAKPWVMISGAGALVLLAGGLIFVMSTKRRSASAQDVSGAAIAQGGAAGALANSQNAMEKQLAENAAKQAVLESEELTRLSLPETTRKSEVLVKHIRESAIKDPVNVTNVLRTWIGDTEGKRN